MKYRLDINGWGSEIAFGKISDEIWEWMQENCDGEPDTYQEMLENDEVPDEFKLAEDVWSLRDAGDLFVSYAANPYSNKLTVVDEKENEVFAAEDCDGINVEILNHKVPNDVLHYFKWENGEKGLFFTAEFEADKFDPQKLKVIIKQFDYDDYDEAFYAVYKVEYDSKELVDDGDGTSTDGKYIDFKLYEDAPLEPEED